MTEGDSNAFPKKHLGLKKSRSSAVSGSLGEDYIARFSIAVPVFTPEML